MLEFLLGWRGGKDTAALSSSCVDGAIEDLERTASITSANTKRSIDGKNVGVPRFRDEEAELGQGAVQGGLILDTLRPGRGGPEHKTEEGQR